jgi:cytosine/adenosine deaminase-related metal-dependent hydrolase
VILRLANVSWRESFPVASSITLGDGHIASLGDESAAAGATIHFENAVAFPGLVNAHDHLDFDLFPPLRRRTYADYVDWAMDIQERHRAEIDPILAIPAPLRARWGVYKNLLGGVTTVVHHGRSEHLPADDLVGFVSSFRYLHSLRFESHWRARLARPGARSPIMVHIGEGISPTAAPEPGRLQDWNLWGAEVIGIHGITLEARQARYLKALVWCPVSNLFLYAHTAPVDTFKQCTPILFGTDSTASAAWNIWDHLRVARKLAKLTDAELYTALNETPAEVFSLPRQGRLIAGHVADICIARTNGQHDFWDAFYGVNPADLLMVLRAGRILLVDEELWPQVRGLVPGSMDRVVVGGKTKLVAGDIATLARTIRAAHPAVTFPVEILDGPA